MAPRIAQKSGNLVTLLSGISKNVVIYRTVMLILVISLTPAGKPLWATMGLTAGDANTAPYLERIDSRLARVENEVGRLSDTALRLSTRITGFQVDFNKYKESHP